MVMFTLMFASLSILVAALFIALIAWLTSLYRIRNSPANAEPHIQQRPEAIVQLQTAAVVSMSDKDRDGFLEVWRSVCSRFPSDPKTAVCYADLLMSDIVGDPVGDGRHSFQLVLDTGTREKYRRAHEIALRNKWQDSKPDELALAMSLYVAVFREVLSDQRHSYRN
jgi:hypothetical protein